MEYWIRLGLTTAMIVAIAEATTPHGSSSTLKPNVNMSCKKNPVPTQTTKKDKSNEGLLCRKEAKNGTLCDDNKKCPVNDDCEDPSLCPCIDGYTSYNVTLGNRNITQCDDIPECLNNIHNCGPNTRCNNTIGGYFCSCNSGFRRGNITEFCPTNNKTENTCSDIDECKEKPNICIPHSFCNNTIGSFQCICISGFKNTSNVCTDINECAEKPDICGPNSTCTNTNGSYECGCLSGFRNVSSNPHNCTDINECKEGNTDICDPRGDCVNTEGSYECVCKEGYKSRSKKCVVKCKTNEAQCRDDGVECLLKRFNNSWTPDCNEDKSDPLNLDTLLKDLDDLMSNCTRGKKDERLKKAGKVLYLVEDVIQNLAFQFSWKMPLFNKNIYIDAKLVTRSPEDEEVSLNAKHSSIHLRKETALGNGSASVVGCLEYQNIADLLDGAALLRESGNHSVKLVTPVVSVFLGVTSANKLAEPVQLRLNFSEEVTSNETHCAFWSVEHESWSTEGCETLERSPHGVVCNCTHLTSFAVLMSLHNIKSWVLDLITQIGLSISIICLALAILTFCCCRILRGTRNTIHIHLCASLLLGHCIFLIGIEAHADKVVCGIVAGLLHLFYLSAFCWMSLEGLELYLMLVEVFKTQVKTRYLLAIGYGVPVVIVTISAAVVPKGYGTVEYCWLSLEHNFIWSFMGPVCVIILVNCGIFVLTVWKLAEKMTTLNPEQGKLKRLRTLTVTSVAQLCILGCCWAFGFLMFGQASLFFAYAFTICNVLQGVQIFFLHCLMNKKIREIYANLICALAHFRSPIYSEFTNSSNVNTHSRAKLNKESGL